MLKVMAPTYENSRNQTKLMMMTMISNKTHFPKMKTQNNLSRKMSKFKKPASPKSGENLHVDYSPKRHHKRKN